MASGTRETIVRWLEARARRDLDRLAELTASDAVWESPVADLVLGRAAVTRQVEEAFTDTDEFASEVLSLDCRGDRAVVVVHNTGRRGGDELDSLQTLFLRVADGLVAEVKIAVDDEGAVERFWAGAGDE